VEDDAIEAMDIKRTLESFGYKVPFTASRGEEAVEKARKELPDLILMDIILKGEMNGIETANKIKELEIPIIYLTAHSEEDAVQKAKLTGPYGYLIKPYDPFELRYAIELALYKNQMEKKLKESEKRYKSIVETANEGIWVTDADFNIDYVNPKITEMLGYTAEEMLGKHVTSFLFEEDIPESEKHIEKRIKGHSETYERRFKHKNGSEISTIISVTALMDDNGDFVGSFAMFTDITHRKKMEKALKNRESQLNAIIDGSPVPQFVIDTNHRVMYWNLAMADISGISPEEIIGTCNHWRAFYNEKRPCLADLVVQGNLDNLNKFYPDKYKESEPLKDAYEIEDFFPHLGDGKWLHLTAAAIKDSKGEIIGSLETLNDITDRKMAEKSAIDQYRFLQYLIDTIPYPVFYKDINYVYMGCNKPFEELMGLSKDEIVGKTVYDIIPKDLADKFHKKDKELFHNPRSQFYEEYIPDANGTMHLILNNKTTFQDEKGQVAGLIGIMVDITERKKTENALKESEEKFRVLADNAPISIIVYQMDKVVYANDFAVQMSGYRKEELYTMNVWDNFYLDDQKLMMKKGEARLRGEKVPNRYEVRFITKSGDVRNIDLSAGSIIYDGQPASLITLTDITERKNAERDLHISQFSIDNASDEIYWVDMEASFIYANKSACESLGFSKEEILSRKVFDIDPNINQEKWEDVVKKLRVKGSVTFESHHKNKDGRIFPVEITINYMNFHGKEIIYAFSRDISEREKALKSLKDSESKFRAFTENSLDTIMLFDSDLKHLYVNPNTEKVTGIPVEDFIGKTHKELKFPQDMVDLWDEALQNVFETGENGRIEFELPSGVWIDWLMIPLLSDDGKVSSVITSARDITERKIMEETLKNSEAEYKAIFEGGKSAVVLYNVINDGSNFVFKDLNRSAELIEQIKRENVIGKKITDVFPNIKDFGLFEIFQRVWKTGKPERYPVNLYQDERIKGWRENYIYKLPSGDMVAVYDDLTEIIQYEEELEKNQVRLKSMVRILQYKAESVQDLLDYALNEAIILSDSKIGYIYRYYADKEQFILNTWSEGEMDECTITDKQIVCDLDKTGIWGDVVRQGKPIILNDYQAEHTLKNCYPEGHASLYKYMTIPLFSRDKIVAVVGVANKETDYNETDVLQLELLMDGVWKIVDTKEAEKALKTSEKRYKAIFENTGTAMAISDGNMILSLVNDGFTDLTGYFKEEIENKMYLTEFFVKEELPRIEEYHRLRRIDLDAAPRIYETILKDRDGTLKDVYMTVILLPETNNTLISVTDITEKKQSRIELERELKIDQALAKIYVPLISPLTTIQDISEVILDEALSLSGSQHGFVAIIDPENKDMVNQTHSKKMPLVVPDNVKIPEEIRFPIGSDGRYHGLFGHCLNTKKAFHDNKAEKHHSISGAPANYWSIEKILCVPVVIGEELVGELALANPPGKNYSDKDLLAVKRIADFFALAIQRKQYEEQINKSLNEKKLLLREIHHRVKNNMQIISSILNLQSFTLKDPNLRDVLKQNQNRIRSMAMIHEKLYQSQNLVEIDFSEYLRGLTTDVFYNYSDKTKIEVDLDLDENIMLNIETSIPCGLIYTELLSNALKHAFLGFKEGKVSVMLKKVDDHIILKVSDNGIGLPEDVDFREASSLGLQLITSLVKQIEGTIELDENQGTSFTIKFQELKYKDRI